MHTALKILSLLLSYPGEELIDGHTLDELSDYLRKQEGDR